MNQDALGQSSCDDASSPPSNPEAANGASNNDAAAESSALPETMRSGPVFTPPADVLETDGAAVIYLDVPGPDAGGLDVTLERRILTVSARVRSPTPPEGYVPAYIEFREGVYERRFAFSDQMDDGHIDAKLKGGVLQLTVPKSTEAGAKKINVKQVEGGDHASD